MFKQLLSRRLAGLLTGLVAGLMFSNPAILYAKTIECGGLSVYYDGVGTLPTTIELPDGYNGISLDPPQTQYSPKDKIKATYRWEHVGTFATRSGTGSLTVTHWKGVTNNSSTTAGFGVSVSGSASLSVGVPDVEQVKTTLTATFGYSSQVTESISSYEKQGMTQSVSLSPSSAIQVWRLAIDFVSTDTGAAYTVGTDNTISCLYSLDFAQQLYVRILGENYEVPPPPTNDGGHVVHHKPPVPKSFNPSRVSRLTNKPEMQARAFYKAKDLYSIHWGRREEGPTYSGYNDHFYANYILAGLPTGWRDCGLIHQGPADPTSGLPYFPACQTVVNTSCGVSGMFALWQDMRCTFPDCPASCEYGGVNTGSCMLQVPSQSSNDKFVQEVCQDWATIAAGGVPTWMNREAVTSTDPLKVEVGWNSLASSDMSTPHSIDITYYRGVQTGKSGQETFSASLGVEAEATGTVDVVSVSGKLSATVSASLTNAWGVEISEDHQTTFSASFPAVAYDAYSLSANYTVGTSSLATISNFVVIVDDGGAAHAMGTAVPALSAVQTAEELAAGGSVPR